MEFIFFIIILFILVFKITKNQWTFDSTKSKGIKGELKVSQYLSQLDINRYRIINNLFIKVGSITSQIDHIVISPYGIFVIETKNYRGWIYGKEQSEYWTQVLYKKKVKFKNPIKQNAYHIYVLKKALSHYAGIYYSLVVFINKADLKYISSRVPVIYDHEIIRTIDDNRKPILLSLKQIESIEKQLNKINIKDPDALRTHIKKSKTTLKKSRKESLRICSQCNVPLVLKRGKYGKFYGCYNYPLCKYTAAF